MSLAVDQRAIAKQRSGSARVVSIPAPVGGWNTRDSIDEMDPRDAVTLDNFIPGIGKVSSRKGYETFLADIAGDIGGAWASDNIETLIPFVVSTTEQFLACTDGGIARIDTGTAAEVKVRATYASDRWQYTTFADGSAPDTPKIIAVNGADTPWTYDGTTHANWAPTGPTAADLIWITSFKNRVFCGEKDTRDFWYGDLGVIPGTLTRFPLSGIRGAQGNLLFMAALTRDTGSGADDYAVFVTDQGQAIVYAGTWPGGGSATWNLVGVYQIPKPMNSRRGFAQLFGDIVIATELDYIFLSQALQTSGATVLEPSKLTGAQRDAAQLYKANYGWELTVSESDNILISNIPLTTNANYQQHVINLQTRAASRFKGWNFPTFARFNGHLYAGGANVVYRVLNTLSDDSSSSETEIQLHAQTAWTDLDNAEIKQVKAIRPLIRSHGDFTYAAEIGVDFVDPAPVAVSSSGPAAASTFWGDQSGKLTHWGDGGIGLEYDIDYDNEAGGPFTNPETISWTGGTGTITGLVDNGADGTISFTLVSGVIVTNNLEITGASSGATADADGAPAANGSGTSTTQTFWSGSTTGSAATAREWRLIAGRGSDYCLALKANIKDQQVDWLSTDYKVHLAGRF